MFIFGYNKKWRKRKNVGVVFVSKIEKGIIFVKEMEKTNRGFNIFQQCFNYYFV